MKVTKLNIFPIKSTRALPVAEAFVQPMGFSFDREFMFTTPDGTFITARKEPLLYRLFTQPTEKGVKVVLGDTTYSVRYTDFTQQQSAEVWGKRFPCWIATPEVNRTFSELFGYEVQLRWIGDESQRYIDDLTAQPLNFADSNPILLISEKSFEQVRQWSPVPLSIGQFRSNIVIDGLEAFEEEGWKRIQIGQVTFRVAQPCTRCTLITRNLETFELEPNSEPFRTLKQRHTDSKGKPIFGIHLIPENKGNLSLGDMVSVIE